MRQTISDVSFSLNTKDLLIEMQVRRQEFFSERTLYYAFMKYCGNYSKQGAMKRHKDGTFDRYSSLRPVYTLNVLDYNYFKGDDALWNFTLYDTKKGKGLGKELINIGYLQLHKTKFENEQQRQWRDFFITGKAPEGSPDYIKKAESLIKYVNLSEEEKTMIDMVSKAQADYDAVLSTTWDDAWDKATEKNQMANVLNGLAKGYPIQVIADITGLDTATIQQFGGSVSL
jgi:predicted transposase/invertase (TIGR01784 family)